MIHGWLSGADDRVDFFEIADPAVSGLRFDGVDGMRLTLWDADGGAIRSFEMDCSVSFADYAGVRKFSVEVSSDCGAAGYLLA